MIKQGYFYSRSPEYDPRYSQAVRAGNTVYVGGRWAWI
jgi:enamine deaminase RidA (YjgF/YER057c/UK114 family)